MPGTFKEECLLVASQIFDNTTKPIKILMSGEKDSEIIALTFLAAEIYYYK